MVDYYRREAITVGTVDPYHAASLEAQGFVKVDGPAAPAEEPKADAEKPLSKLTAGELKAYAAAHGIEIASDAKKPEVLAAIKAAEAAEKPAEGEQADVTPEGDDEAL